MTAEEELKKIKKIYGENFMKMCRKLFPTILEKEGRLIEILSASFSDNSKTLYEDITTAGLESSFKSYIYSKIDVEDQEKELIQEKTPYQLLKEVGYDLIECTTEEEIQKFKKYYVPGEELCTFNGYRLNKCLVFWAIKENAEDIKREDFKNPQREDEYGTSVMGIQFNKEGMCTVSIKNRYNHTVNNPDATYGNDLDRIVPGLTQSFGKLLRQRGLELNSENIEELEIPGYTVASDGKYYKYNKEINGIYYCPGNVIIEDGEAHKLENPEKQILIDRFILDRENKKIEIYDKSRRDSFIDDFEDIEKIDIIKNKEKGNGTRTITIYKKGKEQPITIVINKNNEIIEYTNNDLTKVRDDFLSYNEALNKLNLPNLTKIRDNFLYNNQGLREVSLPNLIEVGKNFLCKNKYICELDLPNLTETGYNFLYTNQELNKLDLPNLIEAGTNFLYNNQELRKLDLPNLTKVRNSFLYDNQGLKELNLPNLTKVGNSFLYKNEGLRELNLPNLIEVGEAFLSNNQGLSELSLPNLIEVGDSFLYNNEGLRELNSPNLTKVESTFLYNNKGLRELNLPNLTKVGGWFLHNNQDLRKLDLPNLTEIGGWFLYSNQSLREVNLPKLDSAEKNRIKSIDIARLDKNNNLTTSEISLAQRWIEKIKNWFKGKTNEER